MDSINRFKIRPKIEEGEALTSYLFRLAESNGTRFIVILHIINSADCYTIYANRYYHLDLIPHRQVDVVQLNNLLNLDIRSLLSHTFFPAIDNVLDDPLDDEGNSFQLSLLVETKVRKFCRKCLLQRRGFQLLPQVKDIHMCDLHKISLESSCKICGKVQPYTRDEMKNGSCVSCTSQLSLGHQECENSSATYNLDSQLKLYEIWKRLMQYGKPLSNPLDGFNIQQTMALKIMYFSQSKENVYKMSRIKLLPGGEIKFLRNLIRGGAVRNHSILGIVIRFFQNSGVSFDEFENIHVGQEYIQSILEDKFLMAAGDCFTPWCDYYKSNSKMMEQTGSSIAKPTHHTTSVCTSCFITFGYERKTGVWEEVGNKTTLISNIILPLLEIGTSRNKIAQIVPNFSKLKLNEIMGYMYNQNLIPKSYKFFPEYKSETNSQLVEKFKVLREHVGGFRYPMIPVAKKLFGWDSLQFHLNYFRSEVQLYLINHSKKLVKEPRLHKDIFKKLTIYKDICKRENKEFSSKDFYERVGLPRGLMSYYNLKDEMSAAREEINRQLLLNENDAVWSSARLYVENMLKNERPFNCQSIYSAIGKRRGWIKDRCPELGEWIHRQTNISKDQQIKIQVEADKINMRNVIKELIDNNQNISKNNVSKYSGISVNKFVGQSTSWAIAYQELIEELLENNTIEDEND